MAKKKLTPEDIRFSELQLLVKDDNCPKEILEEFENMRLDRYFEMHRKVIQQQKKRK